MGSVSRFTVVLCALGALLLCGCSQPKAPDSTAAPQTLHNSPAPALGEGVTAAPSAPTISANAAPARQYGEEMALTADHSGFTATLRYPMGGLEAVNQALSDWAETAFAAYEAQALSLGAGADGIRAQLDVDYEARMAFGRYVSVKEVGDFYKTAQGGVEPVLFTYNYDLSTGRQVFLGDVIDLDSFGAVSALLTDRLLMSDGSALAGNTDVALANAQAFVLRSDGVEWLFSGASNVVGVVLDYATLAPFLVLDTQSAEPVVTAAPSSGSQSQTPTIEQTATSLYDGVQVYAAMEDGSAVLGILSAGQKLDVVKSFRARGWHEIWYNGQLGYVSAEFTLLANEPDAFTTGYVTSSYLHVRSEATVDSALLGTLQNQEWVRIVDPNPYRGWYKIWFENQYAYVYAQYIHIGSTPIGIASPVVTPSPGQTQAQPRIVNSSTVSIVGVGACTANGVIIRSQPNGQSPQYGLLARGDQVCLIAAHNSDGWDTVFVFTDAARGYVGYVDGAYVSVATPETAQP